MDRRALMAAVGGLGLAVTRLGTGTAAAGEAAAAPEKPRVTLGVGGKPLLYYLPLTVAERKGFFKEEGLEVEINDFGGGARSLQALVAAGAKADVMDLPAMGIKGNSHMLMMDRNSDDVARLVHEWLGRQGLTN